MNAVLREYAVRELPQMKTPKSDVAPHSETEHGGESDLDQPFWQWFAVGLLLFCWCAEASMFAQRGF